MVMMEEEAAEKGRAVIFRDIRRYYCDYCGICRSKKSLITSHVLTHHKVRLLISLSVSVSHLLG
jgi:general transcription factor IIIA